ncbi:MAG TPA: hypothetical protein VK210_14510, partial [Terriglobia bacterium]|nr:hypothetical protein [Terriglobia bacterium]
ALVLTKDWRASQAHRDQQNDYMRLVLLNRTSTRMYISEVPILLRRGTSRSQKSCRLEPIGHRDLKDLAV